MFYMPTKCYGEKLEEWNFVAEGRLQKGKPLRTEIQFSKYVQFSIIPSQILSIHIRGNIDAVSYIINISGKYCSCPSLETTLKS